MTMLGNTPHGSLASPFGASARRSAEYLRDYVQEKAIPGLSATVAANGRIVWSEGFGWADLENRSPVTPLTRFRIGSVSKPFAALLLATLATQGQVCLDAEIQAYLPTFPVKRWPVTLRQLASHLGGIRSYEGTEYLDNAFGSIQAGLEVFRNDPLVHQPGTEFHYSSYGYNLLGALIENVCGADFAACLERHVIEPLGLRNTIPDYPDRLIPFRARPYELSPDGAWRNAPVHDLLYKLPAGGLLSTTGDLVRFGLAHLGGGAISSEAPVTSKDSRWPGHRSRL
jgi:serine beta-lactamase-like protein LACTB